MSSNYRITKTYRQTDAFHKDQPAGEIVIHSGYQFVTDAWHHARELFAKQYAIIKQTGAEILQSTVDEHGLELRYHQHGNPDVTITLRYNVEQVR